MLPDPNTEHGNGIGRGGGRGHRTGTVRSLRGQQEDQVQGTGGLRARGTTTKTVGRPQKQSSVSREGIVTSMVVRGKGEGGGGRGGANRDGHHDHQ